MNQRPPGTEGRPAPLAGLPLAGSATREQAQREGRLVLVAEDHPINREIMVRQLGQLGFWADATEDGASALAQFRASVPALVLSDLDMPVLDGRALAFAIRCLEREGRPRTPLVALTATADVGDRREIAAHGFDDCLVKPVSRDELLACLRTWLPRLPWADPAPSP